jgi:LysR family nitrogen assimilation transcriptional regulator
MRSQGDYLDLAALAAFVEQAERSRSRHLRAADVPVPVAAHISQLETNLGVRLFEMDTPYLQLTQAGQRLQQNGSELLASSSAAFDSVVNIARNPAQLATFATPPTVTAVLASPIAINFHRALPYARLRFIEGMSGHIREWLATGRIDVGVLYESQGLVGDRLWSDPLFVVADESILGSQSSIEFAQLAQLPLLLPSPAHGLRQLVDRFAEKHGVKLDVRIEGDSLNALIDWVIEGLGAAVLPEVAVTTHHRQSPTVRCVPIVAPTIECHLVLCTASNKHTSATVRTLLKVIREEVERLMPRPD